MKNSLKKIVVPLAILALTVPFLVSAADTGEDLIKTTTKILNALVPLLLILITVLFIWGIVVYITAGGDADKIAEGRRFIIWAVIAFAVILAIWALARILARTFVNEMDAPVPTTLGQINT